MIKLKDIVISMEFLTANKDDDYSYDNHDGHGNVTGKDKEWPFYISHVDPTMICSQSSRMSFDPKISFCDNPTKLYSNLLTDSASSYNLKVLLCHRQRNRFDFKLFSTHLLFKTFSECSHPCTN